MNRRSMAFVAVVAVLVCGSQLAQAQKAAPPAAQAARVEPVNLNTASAAQLETLPGIGPKTAGLIIEYRQKNGGFKKVEDVMNVRGVGEKSFLKLKSLITVTPLKPEQPGGTPVNASSQGR